MKTLLTAVLFAATFFGCGLVKVNYNIVCAVTCEGNEVTGVAAAAVTTCELDGQDTTTISSANVSACLAEASKNCPTAKCACAAERTTVVCN